ncbi:hypothetical protein VTP01DRAFT_6416 [Rhizomucor pusillus]|uniref:uncharacterized protein n=1 Tax=Rhizomucor pusillus TaxID=4840 RepID=UPI0037430345
MSIQIFYKDGQGNVVDEHGRPEPMDYIVDEEVYALQTVSSHTQYLRNIACERNCESFPMHIDEPKDIDIRMREATPKRTYTIYTDQDKVRFFKLMFEKVLSASAAAKQLGIHVRTAQKWALQYEKDPDSIFEKRKKKKGRPRILNEEHKKVILEYVDENLSVVLEQLMERLLQRFEGLKLSKTTLFVYEDTMQLVTEKSPVSACRQEQRG